MLKEKQYTLRVEPSLREDFNEAARINHTPAAQVLRDFMRNYVEATRARTPANDSISRDEHERRLKAVNYARASVGLEGFKPTPAAEALAARFVSGEISMADYVKQMPTVDPELSR